MIQTNMLEVESTQSQIILQCRKTTRTVGDDPGGLPGAGVRISPWEEPVQGGQKQETTRQASPH